ncbi:MAG: helix-turn-helix transcriptional regulator [Clostridiales bacterium]|jgi:transcriptional regulator with XRE-family HTH domain|nr:helix-turn-helix transcriptional regulator [Clostridiales bacterium]
MDKDTMLHIGKRLRRLREKTKLTRERFAERVGISPQFLAEIENGKKGMSADTLYKICDTFDFSADYILFGRISSDNLTKSTSETLNLLSEPYLSYTEDIIEIVDKIINEVQKK